MKQIKSLCAIVATAMFCLALSANAQQKEDVSVSYPQIFIGVQGGGQITPTDYDNWKLLTPTASLSVGSFFTPIVGARLHLNGIWNKGGFANAVDDFRYKYKSVTTDLDLMVNMVTLFGKKFYYPLNVYLIGGIGMNYAWDNGDAFARQNMMDEVLTMAYEKNCFSHNARIGAQLDYNLSKHVSLNLEVAANCLKDRYNNKMSNRGDWQLTAQLGVAYKFAAKKKKKAVEETDTEIWETRQDTIWYDETKIIPKVEGAEVTWTVFYKIRESDFEADKQLAQIGTFLKEHRECKVDVKSYADAQTGNAKINMEYSKLRQEKAVKALIDAGVPQSAITSNYYGDTVQPFAENDKNRVTIIVATSLKDVNEEQIQKTFKTKEVKYRVK